MGVGVKTAQSGAQILLFFAAAAAAAADLSQPTPFSQMTYNW